ncbi:MAG: hypothetical protein ABR592_07130, partial [Nitriliruptorales bacterium]
MDLSGDEGPEMDAGLARIGAAVFAHFQGTWENVEAHRVPPSIRRTRLPVQLRCATTISVALAGVRSAATRLWTVRRTPPRRDSAFGLTERHPDEGPSPRWDIWADTGVDVAEWLAGELRPCAGCNNQERHVPLLIPTRVTRETRRREPGGMGFFDDLQPPPPPAPPPPLEQMPWMGPPPGWVGGWVPWHIV